MAKTPTKTTKSNKKSTSSNKARKEAVDSVKKATPVKPKQVSADVLIETVANHISGIINAVRAIDDRKFSDVTEIIEAAVKELENEGKLGRQDPKSKSTRKTLELITAYLEDQSYAIDLLKQKF